MTRFQPNRYAFLKNFVLLQENAWHFDVKLRVLDESSPRTPVQHIMHREALPPVYPVLFWSLFINYNIYY